MTGKTAPKEIVQFFKLERHATVEEQQFSAWVEIDNNLNVAEIISDVDIVLSVVKNLQGEDNGVDAKEESVREMLSERKVQNP